MNNDDKEKLSQLSRLLDDMQAFIGQASLILRELGVREHDLSEHVDKARQVGQLGIDAENKIVEGVFDGQHMIGPDGKQYAVPANYASKSKLVEGDILKLTIMQDGSFVYKQIGPVERKRLLGVLVKDEDKNDFRVLAEGRSYRVLLASVTYFKGEPGDEAVILVPTDADSKWSAIENIVKNFSKSHKPDLDSSAAEEETEEIGARKLLDDGTDSELTHGADAELTGFDAVSAPRKTKKTMKDSPDDDILPPEEQGTSLEDLDL